MNSKTIPTYRVGLTEEEIELVLAATINSTDDISHRIRKKLTLIKFKISHDMRTPDYIGLSETARESRRVVSLEKLGELPRETDAERFTHTPEEQVEAEFAAADYFVSTGEKKDWKEFLTTTTKEESA